FVVVNLLLGCMVGPFSRSDIEIICRGPFYASPLIVVAQDNGPGLEVKKRICK
ncbi:hypothetical protein C8F04DRAFT_909996, partial [Mycena alexandri]